MTQFGNISPTERRRHVDQTRTIQPNCYSLCVAYIFVVRSCSEPHRRLSINRKIAKLTGANAADVPELLAGSAFPDDKAQRTTALLDGGTAKAIGETAKFLKEQAKVETVLPDYSPYVSAKFVTE